jgi:hypothetical protein
MNYCIYFKQTGIIERTSHIPITSDEVDYIEVSADEISKFLSGDVNLTSYRVIKDRLDIPKLVLAKELDYIDLVSNRKIYAVPYTKEQADFSIIQNLSNKTCIASLKGTSRSIQINHKYIVLAACVPGDPHWPYWVWNIKYSDIIDNDVKISYVGVDDIRFYTKKIFNSYSHEQHS